MDHALPRLKVKRKRRKPPGPRFWWALRWLVWDVMFLGWDIVWGLMASEDGAPFLAGLFFAMAVLQALACGFFWKIFQAELRRWLDDE